MSAPVVQRELPCVVCGYSLRGLATTAQCPECGTGVAHSLRPELLVNAAPAVLRELRRGSNLITWGMVSLILATLVDVAGGWWALGLPYILKRLMMGALTAVFAAGWWLLTPVEPAHRERRTMRRRIILRLLTVAAVVLAVLRPLASGLLGFVRWFDIDSLVLALVVITGMRQVRWLGGRIPDPRFVFRTRLVNFFASSCIACHLVIGLILVGGQVVTPLQIGIYFVGLIEILLNVSALVAFLLVCWVMVTLRERLERVAAAGAPR